MAKKNALKATAQKKLTLDASGKYGKYDGTQVQKALDLAHQLKSCENMTDVALAIKDAGIYPKFLGLVMGAWARGEDAGVVFLAYIDKKNASKGKAED